MRQIGLVIAVLLALACGHYVHEVLGGLSAALAGTCQIHI